MKIKLTGIGGDDEPEWSPPGGANTRYAEGDLSVTQLQNLVDALGQLQSADPDLDLTYYVRIIAAQESTIERETVDKLNEILEKSNSGLKFP